MLSYYIVKEQYNYHYEKSYVYSIIVCKIVTVGYINIHKPYNQLGALLTN